MKEVALFIAILDAIWWMK